MAETGQEPDSDRSSPPTHAEDLLGLGADVAKSVVAALDGQREDEVARLVAPLHAAEVADLLEQLKSDRRHQLVERLRDDFDPVILVELDETVRGEVADQLGDTGLATAIAQLETDDALMLIASLDATRQRDILPAIPAAVRAALEHGLTFPKDSAGRLMQRDFVAVPTFWSVGETIDFLRDADDLPNDFYDIFVVDPGHRPVGTVAVSRVLRSQRSVPMDQIMAAELTSVPVNLDQEEVAYIFAQHDLISVPVVDVADRLIGVIMVDDIVDVIHEEAEEDLMRLGGVREDDLYADVLGTGRARFSWLFLNLVTAILASVVIAFFQDAIAQIVILAVLMPIAASMGGNAGTQTLTVVVRAIAMKDLTPANAWRVFSKEVLVGVFNGLSFAAIVGIIAWVWSGDFAIGLVMAAAMIVTMVIAGLVGTAIPIGLSRTGIDPAVASGVFLTTITDVVAFFAFLGLAAWFLL
jgi:magnesium transporter